MTSDWTPEKRREWRLKKLAEDPEYFKRYQKQYRDSHRENIKATRKKYLDSHPGIVTKSYTKWRKNNPDKFHAKLYAQRHVPLKEKCEHCGSTEQLERHHFDYSKPLDVTTLCKRCHEAAHVNAAIKSGIDTVKLPNRHCNTCGLVYPNCSRKAPSFKGRNCSLWIEPIKQKTGENK
jgi:hypothetical protein